MALINVLLAERTPLAGAALSLKQQGAKASPGRHWPLRGVALSKKKGNPRRRLRAPTVRNCEQQRCLSDTDNN